MKKKDELDRLYCHKDFKRAIESMANFEGKKNLEFTKELTPTLYEEMEKRMKKKKVSDEFEDFKF